MGSSGSQLAHWNGDTALRHSENIEVSACDPEGQFQLPSGHVIVLANECHS